MDQHNIELASQHTVGAYSSWEIWDAPIVTKRYDKTINERNIATIPKEMYWFFNTDSKLENKKIPIKIIYNGELFHVNIKKTIHQGKHPLVRAYMGQKLLKLINEHKNEPGLTLVFQKPLNDEKNIYYLSLRSSLDVNDNPKSWLITWSPSESDWKIYENYVRKVQSGIPVELTWRCQTTEINPGDRVYFLLKDTKESGVVASGTAIEVDTGENGPNNSEPNEEKTDQGVEHSVEIVLDTAVNKRTQKFLSIKVLQEKFREQKWNNADLQSIIKEEYSADLEKLWTKTVGEVYSSKKIQADTGEPIKDVILHVKRYISSAGFRYDERMIENFYLSLKSKPFVILAGISGTGKTRLAYLFAKAIGAEYLMVSVRPDWSDSTDLFGHVGLNGTFVPGAVLDFIHEANQNPQKPYILCLDEMNLARVEYYLSDILSVIETREFSNGRVVSASLITANLYGPDLDAREAWGEMGFPENLYIVGTVNMDETTFPFSRKVLDRANTIEFSYVDLRISQEEPEEAVQPLQMSNAFLRTDYLLLNQCEAEMDVVEKYIAQLQEINTILREANAHVGYRVRDEIVFYLLNNRKNELMPETDAMDHEIMQKILPRISGSSGVVRDMLCDLFKYCAGDFSGYQIEEKGLSAKMLRAAEEPNCRYPRSAKKIAYMVGRLEDDGFTSYWL